VRVTDEFYAVWGTRQRRLVCARCNFLPPGGIVDCLMLEYPARETKRWNPIVTRISRSLRSGRGVERR
jgi:hypothetical protein